MVESILRQSRSGQHFLQPVESDSVTWDMTELVRLAEDMRMAGARLSLQIPRIIKRGANNIKVDARRRYRAQAGKHQRGHAWRYPLSITYDIWQVKGNTVAVIGPDKEKKQGALGNLLEFGSPTSAPLPHLIPAFEEELPKAQTQLMMSAIRTIYPGL